ncbi:MAG: glycosyltransferase family 9 protein [Candidatus Omnitrophica bacterium]|nr:glycosyltransferase family 9 protein [Candidatus Omnitrophota bacterium]
MRLKEDDLKRILIISLSNIGDMLLTLPVLGSLRRAFPSAEVSLLVGRAGGDLFLQDPRLREVILYDKEASLREKWDLIRSLRKKRFDLVVDLRNSLFPLFIGAPHHTRLFTQAPSELRHKIDRHLWKLNALGIPTDGWRKENLWIPSGVEDQMRNKLSPLGVRLEDPFIVVSPGSKSDLKRWRTAGFRELSDRLLREKRMPLLFVGDPQDRAAVETITASLQGPVHSLVGQTSLLDLAVLIREAKLLITNDSAPLHVATLLGTPTVAIFGPTDPKKYGPRSPRSEVVRKELFCSPCEKAQCPYHHECMEELEAEEVYQACCKLL